MAERMKFNDQLSVGPQPDERELESLSGDGFRSVINFRTAGEDDQPLSPEQEGEKVRSAGLKYLHIPVSMDGMEMSQVDEFRKQYASLPRPVFAHCKSGKRAGAMLMMDMAVENGMSGEQALEKAKNMGFECDKPELAQFVKDYVNQRSQSKA